MNSEFGEKCRRLKRKSKDLRDWNYDEELTVGDLHYNGFHDEFFEVGRVNHLETMAFMSAIPRSSDFVDKTTDSVNPFPDLPVPVRKVPQPQIPEPKIPEPGPVAEEIKVAEVAEAEDEDWLLKDLGELSGDEEEEELMDFEAADESNLPLNEKAEQALYQLEMVLEMNHLSREVTDSVNVICYQLKICIETEDEQGMTTHLANAISKLEELGYAW